MKKTTLESFAISKEDFKNYFKGEKVINKSDYEKYMKSKE